jgi:hypothetical protein
MSALKPCPFCGGEVQISQGQFFDLKIIICSGCGAVTNFVGCIEGETIKRYNKRVDSHICEGTDLWQD